MDVKCHFHEIILKVLIINMFSQLILTLSTEIVFVRFLYHEAVLFSPIHTVVSGRKSLCFPHLSLTFDSSPGG